MDRRPRGYAGSRCAKASQPSEDPESQSLPTVADRVRRSLETEARRRVIALFDDGEVEPGVPFLIRKLAPPQFEVPEAILRPMSAGAAVMHAVSQVMAWPTLTA